MAYLTGAFGSHQLGMVALAPSLCCGGELPTEADILCGFSRGSRMKLPLPGLCPRASMSTQITGLVREGCLALTPKPHSLALIFYH